MGRYKDKKIKKGERGRGKGRREVEDEEKPLGLSISDCLHQKFVTFFQSARVALCSMITGDQKKVSF